VVEDIIEEGREAFDQLIFSIMMLEAPLVSVVVGS
jgi:hypothetical protein